MTHINRKKQKDNKKTTNSVVARVAGFASAAVAIASVGVAARMALKDDETREKGKKVLKSVKDQAIDYIDKLKSDPDAEEGAKMIKKVATETKKVVEKSK